MIDNSLLMGIVLIGVGLALALIAYAVLLYRRENEAKNAMEGDAAASLPDQAEGPPKAATEPAMASRPAVPPPTVGGAAAPLPAAVPPPADSRPSPIRAGRRLFPVASLLREEVSGDLVIQIGERTYRRADELHGSADESRVQAAFTDLAHWVADLPAAKAGAAPSREEPPAKSGSMIEQINTILLEKMATAGSSVRGVRLVEGAGGTIRVLVGIHSYPMEEVPDPEVRQLIRQAVAEWEGRS